MQFQQKRRKATALITCLCILFIFSTLAISFSRMTTLETRASGNYSDALSASLLAQAGIDNAILRLREDFSQSILKVPRDWLCRLVNGEPAIGIPVSDINNNPDAVASYQLPIPEEYLEHPVLGRKISGKIGDNYHIYTLKIHDTSSQLNLNNQIDVENPTSDYSVVMMGNLLDRLSSEIAKVDPYKTEKGDDGVGPLKRLGQDIIRRRNQMRGFKSKFDILGTYGNKTITREDLRYVWDYITVYPTVEEMKDYRMYKNIRSDTFSNENYQIEYRCPVNVNTASRPLLIALFTGLCEERGLGTGGAKITITASEAEKLVNKLIQRRQQSYFTDWESFFTFLEDQKREKGVFFDESNNAPIPEADGKIALLKANCDPNVHLRRSNPETPIYQVINKSDLSSYTTELCFHPLGRFEITSLGQILNNYGQPQNSIQKYAVIQIFDIIYYTSQHEFEGGESSLLYGGQVGGTFKTVPFRLSEYESDKKGVHSFSYANNILQDYASDTALFQATSNSFGHIVPIAYDLRLWENEDRQDWDSINKTQYRLFHIPFNGSYIGTREKAVLPEDKIVLPNGDTEFKQNPPSPAFPKHENSILPTAGSLFPDGVVFRKAEADNAQKLYYEAPAPQNGTGVFPPVVSSSGSGDVNEGTIMFWFKLNPDWDSNQWRTIFFATHNELRGSDECFGVQREIQMKVEKVNPQYPLLRKVHIRVKNQYFYYVGNEPKNPVTIHYRDTIPFEYLVYEKMMELNPNKGNDSYGLHAQEWYHLAVRWKDGTAMESFRGRHYQNNAIAICGMFYNNEDKFVRSESGPIYYVTDHPAITDTYYEESGEPEPGNGKYRENEIYKYIPDNKFAAIRPALKGQNRIYLGSAGFTASPEFTLDDFQVYKAMPPENHYDTGITALFYKPSRYPAIVPTKIDNKNFYGVFQGRFKGKARGSVSSLSWTTRKWGEIKPGAPKQSVGTYSVNLYETLWNMMTDNAGMGDIFKILIFQSDRYKATVTVKVYQFEYKQGNKTFYRWDKYFSIALYDLYDNNKIKSKREKWTNPNELDPQECPNERKTDTYEGSKTSNGYTYRYTFSNSSSASISISTSLSNPEKLTKILEAWFDFMKNTQKHPYFADKTLESMDKDPKDDSTPVNSSGEPYVVDSNQEFRYEIRFPIDSPGVLYKSPIIDDITMVYLLEKPKYRETVDGGLLP